ncbi:Filamentous hemagglutinin family N-terminal domain protein [Fusobacterium necrophorum subsp. funduliforme]
MKEVKEKIEMEEDTNGENNPENDTSTPMALLNPEAPAVGSYISTSALGSMHGNQILMRADDSGFYGVQYSGEQKKNAISIDKQTGEIDVRDLSSSSLTPRSVKLKNTSESGFEEIPEEEIEGNTTATPVLHKSSQKAEEDGYNLEEEEVTEGDISGSDINTVNKNISMNGYQSNGLIPRTVRNSSAFGEYEEIPKEVLEEAERGEEATSVTTLPANSTSLLTEALPVEVKQVSVPAATKAPVTPTPVSETTPAAVQAVPVSAPVGITAAPKTISEETLQEAVEVKKPKAEVLKRLNHIEVKDPSKTQLEKVDGHDKSTLIQIAAANDNGISHNEYDQFSIDQDENVLLNNNSSDSESASKLLNGKTFAGNKNLKGKSASLIINEVGLNNQGATKLAGGLEVLGKKSDIIIANENGVIVNGGRFENVGDLTLSTGKYKEGRTKEDFQFEERKGKIDVVGKSDIQNNLNIYSKDFDVNADLSAQNLNVDAAGQVSVKNATVSVEDVVDINTKTLRNSNAKIQSKNAVKIKGEDIFNEENSKISADVLLIDGKKVENSGEIEASYKLGIHATEDIINKRVIAGKILDLKAGKSFKNIDSALLYAQEQLQVDANEISNIGSSILSNGSLFLRGENAITNEKGGMIQSKGDGRLIGRKITNNASSISSLAKLYLKTDELLNIGEFNSSLKVTDQVRKLYKHVDVRESSWKAWYNGYNITVSIPRAKKELRVKQALINAGDDLVISKYKNDKTQVYNRDSSITSRGNIYVEGSIDNLTTTSASTLESILKRTKVKLAWNTSSLVDRSQFSSGVDVDGASLFDLLKEKDKLKRYQYFNLLKGLNDSELDRILNQALGEDWKAKDDIPDLKLGGSIEYYSADNRARVDSSKNIFVEGDIENSSIVENVSLEQWKKEKPKIDQEARRIEDALFNTKVTMLRDNTIAQENIDVDGSRKVSVLALLREKDPKKRVAYFEKLKTINDPKLEEILASTLGKDWKSKKEVPVIKEGYVGKKKKENTIYQMILEDGDERGIDDIYQLNNNDVKLRNILQKQNGKYEKLKDNREFLFKTSDIIKDKVQYKGYDYLVEGLKAKGKNTSKTKLIGDSQYQYDMISNLWKSYDQKAPDKEYIEDRFKASLEEANRLNLEIGKPLTKQQQKELNRSIIWYVEKEIEGEKVLTPVMYFPEDKLHTLSRIREDKAISKISAWGNIFGESDNVTNENSTINAVKNVKLRTNVLVNRGSKEFDSDIYAGEDLDIEAKKVLSEFANLKATGNIDVTARNIDVTASDIVSKSNVNLRAENIDIKDKILKSSTKDINSKTVGKAGHIMEDVTTSTETSRASNIRGENVSVRADENLNVKGSKIRAEETAEFDAAKVNIEASKTEKKDSSRAQGSGVNSKGLLEYLTEETATRKTEETNESSIEAGKNLYVKAKEDLHLKGSDLKARNATLSGRKVTIENEEEKSSEESSKFSSQVFGISNEKKSTKSTKARGSNVEATGTLVVEAEEEAKIKGSNLKAGQGYVDAKKTKFEAAKETYEEKVSKTSLGLTASGSAGILGVGVEGEADGAERSAGGSVVNEYKNKKLPQGTNGGRKSSALAEGEIGLKLAHQKSEKEEQKWKNSTFKTTDGDLNVTAKGENDIGGLDISSKGETNIVGKKVLTTKQKNTTKEQSYGFELSAKQSGGTTSSVVDALTTAKEIADDSQNGQLNKGLAAAKTIGAATGLLFNDLVGVQSRQSLNFSFNHSKSEMEEDTKNKIHSEGKLNIRSTEEDIELKNTEIKSKEKVTLDSERDIKVSGGKKIEKSEGHQFRAEAHLQESAGFGALSGGNTQVGIGGSTNYEREESSSTTNENSTIGAKDLQIRSKRHTDIKGANVRAEEKATVKVGGNLTVKSETDQYKEQKVKANAGLNGSLGVSSNTIVTGNGNASAGGGQIWKEGERITERSGLTAGNSMDIEVGGNLNVDSATVGSDIKKGKLDVEGDINTTDRTTQEKSGGAVVGASGGLTGEIGADLEIGDKKNREIKSNSVLSFQKENISAKKVTQNGEKSNIESLKTDMVEETEVVRNEFEKGGSANLSFSVNDTKKIAGAVKGAVKSAVQKVRSYTSSSENLSSSGRGHRTEEISTPTRRQEDSREDIYSKLSGEGVYSLAGKSGSQEGTYENVGAGKRGEAPEKPARKAKEIEAENPYSTIGDNESIPKDRKALANRPLPEISGVRKSSESSDGIYETIKTKNKNSDHTYSTVGSEGIYSLAGRAKTSDENSPYAIVNKERKRNNEDIYSKLSGEGVYSLAGKSGSQEGTYENVGAGKRGEAPEKPARKVKGIEAENPYSTIGDSESIPKDRKALANRPLPEIPGVRKSSESSDGIYETIKAKPTEDKLIPKSQRASSGDYESIPEEKIRREKIQSRELSELPKVVQKSSNNKKIERIYEDLDSIQRTSDGNAKEPVYAKVDLSKKTPKVVSQEEVVKQKAEELTKQYGPKVTVTDETGIYSQVKRVGKPSTPEPETLTVKPKFAEEGLTSRSQRTAVDYEKLPDFDEQKANSIKRENPYELDGEDTPIPEIRKAGEREVEAIIKTRTVNGEDTYEPIIRRKYSDSKFDEISLSDPPSLRERLQQEAGQKLTFTETSVSNTDYIPKKLSKNEIEALSEKARKVAENKDPHEATMEKIKKIAEDPNNIPKEHLLSKLEEYTYGYKNDDVIRLANRSAEEGSKLIVPDMVDKSKITKQDQKNLGEIMEKLPFSDDYNQFRRQVDEKIYDKLSNNPEFKDLMNKPLSGNEANIQKLFDIVVQAKKDSFKELAGVDIETPKLVLNKDKKQKVHGEYLDDTVTMGAVPPIKSKKQEDHNKELLNTIIHELTHHDQAYLAGNKDNPNLKRNLQEEARVFGVNQDLYVPIASHKHGYKEQPLERDAFRAGDALSDRLMKKVYRGSEESGLKGIGNTDYIPKPVTKKQREALEKKAKKYQQSDEFADSYNNFRNGIDQKIMDNLSIDPQFKKLINSDLSGDFEKVKELISVVARAKKNSLEAMGETNVPKTELQLKEAVAVSSNGRNRDEQNADILNNILKQYTYRIGEEAGTALVKKISGQKVEETAEGIGNTTYIPKKVDTAEIEKLSKQAKEKHENRDSEKEALKKLQTIAQAAGELPKEHLVKALAEMTKGRSFEEIAALYQKAKETGIRNIVRPDTIGEFSGETAKAMGELYKKVSFDDSYIKAREEINKKTLEKLDSNKEFHDLMKTKLSGNTEAVRKLYDMVVTAKNESLQEVTGIKAPKPELKISEGKRGYLNPVEGVYHNDVVKMNDTPFLGFTKTKKQNNRQLLDTLIHELTHYDQDVLTRSTKNPNLPEALRPDIDLMNHNFKYYINSRNDYFTYKKQPVEREAFLSGHKLAEDLGKALARGFQGEKADGVGNTKYIPEKLSGAKKKALFDDAKKQAKQRDTAKEAEKKLKLLAENADSIPKEHMLKAVKELAYGLSVEDATALRKKAVELGTKIHRPDMIEGFEGKNVKNMGEILKKIQFDQEYVKTREEINQKIVEKLDSNKEFHDLMKQKLSGNEEGIKKLFKMVESAKHDSLKEVTGIDGKRAEVVLNTERGPLSMKQGHYADNEVNMNAVPLLSFLRTKKQNNKEILDTIVHELTHHDQAQITRNKDRNLPEHMKQDADLMALNETYYINSDLNNFSAYKNQPLEREAFISGHKLGEQLSKLVDKGYTGDAGENGKLREIKEIEHLPNKVNNLESPKEAQTDLGNNSLIYGLKNGREELIHRANAADKQKKNAILADSYIGDLNLGFEFSRLSDFASKVNAGKVTDADIDAIANYKDLGAENALASSSRSRINAANTEDNKKIITELLKNKTAVNALKKMDDLNQQERKLLMEVKKIENIDVDNPQKSKQNTEAENKLIDEYNSVKEKINKTRVDFFAEKTKLIAKETLEGGGKLYFSLDGVATDTMKYDKNKTNVDFDKLKDLFDSNNPYYDAVTSKELRYLYDNYRDNPNLKFTIKDHVIENPLKTLKVEDVEVSSERDQNSVVMEKSLLPKLFRNKVKDQGPIIKHLGGEETTSHYFPLDKIVTRNADISKDMKVNLDNIKKAFTPGDKHYNDSESKSLREMYKKDSTMEQTKFIIGNQVITNPFKNPELQEYIKSQQGKESQVTASPKKAEVRKAVKAKVAGGQEISSTQEPIYAQVQKRNRGQIAADSEAPNKPLPPIPTPRTKRGVTSEASENQRTLRSQENAEPGSYYTNRVVNQTSQAPSTGDPVYADLTFRGANSKNVRNGHVESDYAEIGRREEFLEAPTRPLPPIPGKPKAPEKRMKRTLKDQENAEPGSYYTNRVVNQTSQAPSTGDPVYADLTFRAANSKAVRDGGVESDYAEVARTRRPVVMEKSLFPNPFKGKAKESGSETLSGAKKKALFDDAKKQAKQRDTAKEAEKKLKLLAENADSIPKEHMLKAVKELAYGLSVEDATALRKKAVELGTKIHRPDMIEGFEGKNVKNMGEILKKIQFDQEYVKTREEINQKIVEKLDSNKEFHDLMKQKLSGNEEGIKKLFKMVESAKHDSLKEVTGIDGKRAEVVLNTERGPLSMKQGHYADNEVNMNAVPLLSFLRTKKQNNKEILDTIVHELTHHDQAQITRNKDRNLPEHMKQDADLMALNETYYINSDLNNFSAYKNQPLEREAFISGHKLGEQLSKLVDKGYTGDAGENGKLREIKEIEHLPNKVNNLESPREAKAELGDNALIYGLKYGRQELIDKVNAVDPNRKNATMADSYIGKLNLGYEFEELTNFAKKVNKGEVTEADIREIANFNDPGAEHARKTESRSRINAANNDDNQKIMNELLKNETAVNSLKKVGELSEKIEDVFSQMRKNEYLDLDNPKESPSFTEEQNRQIREFRALENEINNARMDFFTEKTKLIAKETLDRGGKLYFALDGLATDSPRYTKNTNVDFDKLKGLFDPGNPYYDAVTSRELRYLYDNYRDNPNLKFTVKDHVIENPLKTLKVEEVETPSERDRNSVVMEKSLLPKLFKSKSKDQGPVIKHLGGEETTSHYFPLDKIVTKNADISRNMKVNLDNIKKAFTPDDRHYNDSESKSLREMYKKDPTMEQTKFIIGNQVIENPFKNPELQEYIKSQQGREAQVVTKAKKAEAKKIVNPKAAGGQETSNAQEAIYAQVRKGNRGQAAVNLEAPNKPLPPVPVSRVKRGAANESSSNQRALRSQESGFVEDGYYVDRVVNQSSQAPSRGEPVYADLQFGKANSGRVRNGHVESDYAEVGKREEYLEAPTRALPPTPKSAKEGKALVKPKVPGRTGKQALQTQESGFVKDGYYVNKVVNQSSQAPSRGEPIYADLQFGKMNSGRVQDGHLESEYAEIGRKNTTVSEETIYENVNSLQKPALPPRGVKTPVKPAVPNRKPISPKK